MFPIVCLKLSADPGWRILDPRELLHVGAELTVETEAPFPEQPRQLLTRSDLDPKTESGQHPDQPSWTGSHWHPEISNGRDDRYRTYPERQKTTLYPAGAVVVTGRPCSEANPPPASRG
jgi:hypothetical protein